MKNSAKYLTISVLLGGALCAVAATAQVQKKTPYWASINADEARMRTGPSTEFSVKWIYKRKDLPLKVIAVHTVWRKVEDPDKDQGWMHVSLLSPARTALVIGSGTANLRDAPNATGRIAWRVEPGVVGKIDDCQNGYCRFDNAGRAGFIETSRLYGDEAP
jgi:SH3-like domain-containing protein